MDKEEAIKILKDFHDELAPFSVRTALETLYPELKESEDEKVREAIICGMTVLKDQGKETFATVPINDCITWLEKQGESYTKRDVDDAWLKGMCDAKRELEKQAEVVSDKDDIEDEEKGIRKAFNKIWEEKQDKQKSQRMISAEAKEAMYDKPAEWSEEDEVKINRIVACLENLKTADNDILLKDVDWLKSLKERIGGE